MSSNPSPSLPLIDIDALTHIARQAGEAILTVYRQGLNVSIKADDSPVTQADLAAHEIIVTALESLYPNVPVLSEESPPEIHAQRPQWTHCFLVDPLDGTKEFIKGNDEFTVNIAWVVQGVPEAGVVYAPALDLLYACPVGGSSFRETKPGHRKPLPCLELPQGRWVMVGSRSHGRGDMDAYYEQLEARTGKPVEVVGVGSSLKFCMVAEGRAHGYGRTGPTSEWDTAAAHAIVRGVGKSVRAWTDQGEPGPELVYNKADVRNPGFICQ